jgi:hypothetical protein
MMAGRSALRHNPVKLSVIDPKLKATVSVGRLSLADEPLTWMLATVTSLNL